MEDGWADLFYFDALHGAVGGRGFAGFFLARRHGAFSNGLIGVHFENFGAVVGAKAAADAGIFVDSSFHVNTSVYLLKNLTY
jgi:hypothetical protein